MNHHVNPRSAHDDESNHAGHDESELPVGEPVESGHAAPDQAESGEDDQLAAEILHFWSVARHFAGLAKMSVVVGQTVNEAMPPQAWSFGDQSEIAEESLAAVLTGDKTATSSALCDYDDEAALLPVAGELSILLDGEQHPRALIQTTDVQVMAFEAVDEEFAAAEGEGARTLEGWRAEHEALFRRTLVAGCEFTPDMPVVCERFVLLYPRG